MADRPERLSKAQMNRLRRNWRKGVYVIPSLLTTANIFCGFYSVMASLAGSLCVRIYDTGALTETIPYTFTVSHP